MRARGVGGCGGGAKRLREGARARPAPAQALSPRLCPPRDPPAAPGGLPPQTQMRVRAGCGAQGAGCGALPAGLGTRDDARPRRRKDTAGQARGAGAAGGDPCPPTCRPRHLPGRPPRPRPRPPRRRPSAQGTTYPVMGTAAAAASVPAGAVASRCGRTPGGQRSAPGTERPGHQAAWPAARARPSAAGEGCGRGLRPSAPHTPHRWRRRATRRARLQPQL